jgi:DNA adenine methylase
MIVTSAAAASARRARPGAAPVTSARPFLKWAGGKRQLLPHLLPLVPGRFNAYVEPFLGSAALFLHLQAAGRIGDRPVRLGDTNADLVGTYAALARDVDAVLATLEALAGGHAERGAEHYYEVRNTRFNPARRALHADRRGAAQYPADLAAMFIYLNRTGFNGLYRLNAQGDFNVPMGRYVNPRICDADRLRAVASVLRRPGVELRQEGFEAMVGACRAGDFVYFDPPYAPLSSTASFTSYTAEKFGDADQRRLRDVVVDLARRGCHVVVSNSTAPLITSLYEDDEEVLRAGLRALRVPARRAINSNASRRGHVDEYIITNVAA